MSNEKGLLELIKYQENVIKELRKQIENLETEVEVLKRRPVYTPMKEPYTPMPGIGDPYFPSRPWIAPQPFMYL